MAVDIKVPTVGESITEGTVSRWLKKDGDAVREGEPVLELETEKATGEIPAPASGTLRITAKEGSTVAIGAVVGRVEEGARAKAEPAPARRDGSGKQAQAARPPSGDNRGAAAAPAGAERTEQEAEAVLSPAARQLAADAGVDVRQIKGTGRGGRITKEDVAAFLEQRKAPAEEAPGRREEPPERAPQPAPPPEKKPEPAPAAPAPRGETKQRMTSIRQRIAERLVAAQHAAAILTTFNEADLSAVMDLRGRYKEPFQKKHGVGLGFMAFFVKASVEALRAFPLANSRIDGNEIITPNYCDIGIAVSTDKGLMVPVLRNAERMSFAEIEKAVADLAQKARSGKITVSDLAGGTFTITNGGVFGSLLSTPLLNPPQSAILGMHAIQKRPVAVDDQVVVRPMMYLALSYDHRLIDGREAVSFLVRVKECIESPERLLLEV
jgi:2-oxoglutarate dehydrogenase E2 component (dihydrolipoamide succinyltransferase)